MKVLSLFDGMSCGRSALRQLGIVPDIYYASEIDKHAIKQTLLNFPDTVQLGDVTKWKGWDVDWKSIDLILAGSPCQGFSFAGKQLAFDDPRSKLFFVFIDILSHIRSLNPDVKFLLENVNMKKSHMKIISKYCGVFPVNINSSLVSAQNRNRWYWTNICMKQVGLFGEVYSDIPQPEDRGIFLRDILESEVDEKYYVSQAVLDRMARKKYSSPSVNPDKAGPVNTKNNSGQMSLDAGTTFVTVDGCVFDRGNIRLLDSNKSNCIDAHYSQFPDNHGQRTSILETICVAMRGRDPQNPFNRKTGAPTQQRFEPRLDGKTNCLTSVQKDNLILQRPRGNNKGNVFDMKSPTLSACAWEQNNLLCKKEIIQLNPATDSGGVQPYQQDWIYDVNGLAPALCAGHGGTSPNILTKHIRRLTPHECSRVPKDNLIFIPEATKKGYAEISPGECFDFTQSGSKMRRGRSMTDECNCLMSQAKPEYYHYTTDYRIRRLTPLECARLQTIPSWYQWKCSDTQQYKMLGNGWTVDVIAHILSFMKERY